MARATGPSSRCPELVPSCPLASGAMPGVQTDLIRAFLLGEDVVVDRKKRVLRSRSFKETGRPRVQDLIRSIELGLTDQATSPRPSRQRAQVLPICFHKTAKFDIRDRASTWPERTHDLNTDDAPPTSKDSANAADKPRRSAPERRESGRFPSAARLLRSLGRSRDEDVSSPSKETHPVRGRPQYQSEGKGMRRKNNWTSERELVSVSSSPSTGLTSKERSHSFCDKSTSATALPSEQQHRVSEAEGNDSREDNMYENLPLGRALERGDKERRSQRKLTKDSGYETSPYSESDYANLELRSDGDDVTLTPDEGSLEECNSTASTTPTVAQDTSPNEHHRTSPEGGLPKSPSEEKVLLHEADVFSEDPPPSQHSSAESLASFANSLVKTSSPDPASKSLLLKNDVQCLGSQCKASFKPPPSKLHPSRSTPNLEEVVDAKMVTKKSSLYYHHMSSNALFNDTSPGSRVGSRYCDNTNLDGSPGLEEYAQNLRSSSYLIHSRQMSALSSNGHSRHHSSASNFSETDECDGLYPQVECNKPLDSCRFFSNDNLAQDSNNLDYHNPWKSSEPDLGMAPPPYSPPKSYCSPPPPPARSFQKCVKQTTTPPQPPVRDASSLKYIKYGPGHEKFPSWPIPASSAQQVISPSTQTHIAADTSLYHGSHRSKSWTEQSEYPKEPPVGYIRPYMKKQFNPIYQQQLKTVMEKCERVPPETYKHSRYDASLPIILNNTYFPSYDKDGRPIDDKDYSIPSPPERDPGMGSDMLEDYVRRYDYDFSDIFGVTPFMDQLKQESIGLWDAGRGDTESLSDSRYSNGRESVTTVVTNSSSASSSETLKWLGSLSDVSVVSRDPRTDIAHSARVLAPQRHNSESVLYLDSRAPKPARAWNKEVEKNNEINNLKKFPSYSYTQPLSQISESVPPSPTIDFSKPPSVAERIHELERQSRGSTESRRRSHDEGGSYTYLDPGKKCRVPDATLKSIQKTGVMLFLERFNGPAKGVARLGVVPDSSRKEDERPKPVTSPIQVNDARKRNEGKESSSQTNCMDKSSSAKTPPSRPPKRPDLSSPLQALQPKPWESKAFKKPPAPDPPDSPPSETNSRSSTPPPPPPPLLLTHEGEVIPDDPLPPPPPPAAPSECQNSDPPLSPSAKTYHKDSYMAHRKDWKSGFEGRYRRTHSPSASPRVPSPAASNTLSLSTSSLVTEKEFRQGSDSANVSVKSSPELRSPASEPSEDAVSHSSLSSSSSYEEHVDEDGRSSPVSSSPTAVHDGPVLAQPAQVTEEESPVIALGYGRRITQLEEDECDRLSADYAKFVLDHKLHSLLVPGPQHKTPGHYMNGVFTLELKKNFISRSHSHHPDLRQALSAGDNGDDGRWRRTMEKVSDRAPLPADSPYFNSESKARMLTKLREKNGNISEGIKDPQLLNKKKEELITSITKKMEILKAEKEAVRDEIRLNQSLGNEVSRWVEERAKPQEAEKFRTHVEEIDNITLLLLSLSGRLARAENAIALVHGNAEEEKVCKFLQQYLNESEYADYDHFIKMKTKLIMDSREIEDKIKLGEEQIKALTEFKKY